MANDDAKLIDTIVRYMAGSLPEDETRWLNATLDESAAARHLFNELSLQMVAVRDWGSIAAEENAADELSPAKKPALLRLPQPSPVGLRSWAWAAASLLAAAIVWQFATAPAPVSQPTRAFATVASLQSARWHCATLAAGDRFGAQRLTLGEGLAQVALDNGVSLMLQAPVDIEFTSDMLVRVRAGSVTARVPPAAIGFTVETESATIIDQGTEFGVQVGERGATLVQVFEGSVEARDRTGSVSEQVAAGKALEFDAAYPVATRQKFQAERFARQFPDPATLAPEVRTAPYNFQALRLVEVQPAPGKVEVDGKLGDWIFQPFETRSIEPYQETYALRGAMMYDAENLYLAAEVEDPNPLVNPHGPGAAQPWKGGAVQVRLVCDRRFTWPYSAEQPAYRRQTKQAVQDQDTADRFVHLMLWRSNPTQQACLHLAYGMDLHGDRVNPPGFQGAYSIAANGRGYTLEYAVPWALLAADEHVPQKGDVLGATWQVQFADEKGAWRGHLMDVFDEKERGWPFHRAATWGKAVYR